MDLEHLQRRLDRFAGGKQAHIAVDETLRIDPKTRRTFTWVAVILLVALVLGAAAVLFALNLALTGEHVALSVWSRTLVALAITVTLFYFWWRAARGWYWAYSRLRLFSKIFPAVTLLLTAIPGLYPAWMVSEQIVFSLLMITVGELLSTDHMRRVFAKPAKSALTADLAHAHN